jgi:hypothetical protein
MDNYYVHEMMQRLIQRLKYLETLDCRAKMTEEERVAERKSVTDQFKTFIVMRDSKPKKRQRSTSKYDDIGVCSTEDLYS